METAILRSRPKRPVTFCCEWCGDEVTEERPPGPRPRYCPGCYPKAQRALSAERVWRYRTRQAELVWAYRTCQADLVWPEPHRP